VSTGRRKPPARPKELSGAVRVVGRGMFAFEAHGEKRWRAVYALVDDATVALSLDDDRRVSAPILWYPRLHHATPAERNNWKLIMGGRAVFWPSLKLAISVTSMLKGEKADEPLADLKKWLHHRKK
jgi:hypothetical protein